MQHIFIINGSGGVGKDTFIAKVAEHTNQPIMNYSSIDKVKEIAKIIGWNGEKTERDRKMLFDLKQLCIAYNDMPLESMREKVNEFHNTNGLALFLHIREPEEIDKAKVAFNAKTVLVKRDSVTQITSNPADRDVYEYNYDIVIDADCTLKILSDKAKDFCEDCHHNTMKNSY